ncbi:MAG: glycosyltransferase [Dehalococcoidia bacterium]
MFGSVPTVPKSLDAYRDIVGEQRIDEIRRLAAGLEGKRVLHINATAFGGGVAEILSTLVPLMQDLGLRADWQVMRGTEEFYAVTKAMHNSLQGMRLTWTQQMQEVWLRYNQINADLFDEEYDFVVVHDPQPAAILALLQQRIGVRPAGHWVWRCHIDLTEAQPEVWELIHPFIEPYDAAIFTMDEYVKSDLVRPQILTIAPAIDPLSPKNVELSEITAREILDRYGVDASRPMILQVSRFDPWKDPLGVIDVYRALKPDFPDLQLVLIASMAHDDPEGWAWYERTVRRAGEDYDIHILSNLNGVGNVEVNAFQRCADVVVQKSVREGFGLVVSEAMWKGRPVVAGNVGGIPLQILYGKTGYLVNTLQECINRVDYLLRRPDVAVRMGALGREHVREHFLITRYLRDYLAIFVNLEASATVPLQSVQPYQRVPVD